MYVKIGNGTRAKAGWVRDREMVETRALYME